MTDIDKKCIIRDLVRASDALHSAHQRAAFANNLDLAKFCREQTKAIGTTIRALSGPVVTIGELVVR